MTCACRFCKLAKRWKWLPKKRVSSHRFSALPAVLGLFAASAHAHPGHGSEAAPVFLAVLFVVGLIAAILNGRRHALR